jgi:hypothetical protein
MLVFAVFVLSKLVSMVALGRIRTVYYVAMRLFDVMLLFFPNSLFLLLGAILRSDLVAFVLLGVCTYLLSLLMGRLLAAKPTLSRIGIIAGLYVALSIISYAGSGYLFFKFFFMKRP